MWKRKGGEKIKSLNNTLNLIDKFLVIKVLWLLVELFNKLEFVFTTSGVELLQNECEELGILCINHTWIIRDFALHQNNALGISQFRIMSDGKERSCFSTLSLVLEKRSEIDLSKVELHEKELHTALTRHWHHKLPFHPLAIVR